MFLVACILLLASPLLAGSSSAVETRVAQREESTVHRKANRPLRKAMKATPEVARKIAEEQEEYADVCNVVEPIPLKDTPSPEAVRSLAKCASVNLYYGIGVTADLEKARHCAYLERDRQDGFPVAGSALLSMIYANGDGVKRNMDLAITLACELDNDDYVRHLARLRKEKWRGNDVDVCDFLQDANGTAICTDLSEKVHEIDRQEKLSTLMKPWSKQDREAFRSLDKAFHSYVKAHEDNEVACNGVWCGVFSINEGAKLKDEFLSDLTGIEAGQFPRFSEDEFTEADRELNRVYQESQKTYPIANEDEWNSITREGIKKTERAWLEYREAWVRFARQRYPKIAAGIWRTWLTKKRIEVMGEALDEL